MGGSGVMIVDEGAFFEHITDGRFITMVNDGGGSSRMMHRKVIVGHILFTDDMMDIFMETEVFRRELVDLFVSEGGCRRYACRYKWNEQSWADNVVTAMLE